MDNRSFGHRVRLERRRKRLTQEALAERIGVSASFMGHIERGTRATSTETLVALCNALEVSPAVLLCDSLAGSIRCAPEDWTEEERGAWLDFLTLFRKWTGRDHPG